MVYHLPPPEQKADYVRSKFDEIARQYDRFNDLITQGQHRRWKRVLVARLGLRPGQVGLDLCCGTGDLALRCLPALAGGGTRGGVIAADFSLQMLRLAKERLRKTRAVGAPAAAQAVCADAMRLPFADGRFHFVTIGYGLRNVTDLRACLREVRRVLRPGGVMASLDLGQVRPRWMRPFADFYLFQVVPRLGQMLQRGQEMYSYLPASTRDYPHQDELARTLAVSGFEGVELVEFLFGASVIHLARKPA